MKKFMRKIFLIPAAAFIGIGSLLMGGDDAFSSMVKGPSVPEIPSESKTGKEAKTEHADWLLVPAVAAFAGGAVVQGVVRIPARGIGVPGQHTPDGRPVNIPPKNLSEISFSGWAEGSRNKKAYYPAKLEISLLDGTRYITGRVPGLDSLLFEANGRSYHVYSYFYSDTKPKKPHDRTLISIKLKQSSAPARGAGIIDMLMKMK